MKILHVLRSKAWGGLEHYALDLIQHLMQQGQQTSHMLLCRQGSRVATEAAIRGISTCHHRSAILESYDLIHVHQRQDLPLVRLMLLVSRRRPVVYSLYMSAPPKKDFYHRRIYGMIDSLMSSSQDLNQEVRMNFPLEQNRIHLVRYGRDTQKQPPQAQAIQEFRTRLNAKDGRLIFATLCRIDPGKGILDIIESLKILSEDERKCFEIWIVGEPTLLTTNSDGTRVYESESIQAYEQLQEVSRDPQFQSCLKLIPYQKDPSLVLASIDVFLLATHKETYSLAVLDAFQMAKPCLGTCSGGTIEQIGPNEERGWFFQPHHPESLADGIRSVMSHKQDITTKGIAALAWVQKEHNWDRCLEEVNSIYLNCSQNRTPSGGKHL